MGDVSIVAPAVQDAGGGYQVPGAQEIIVKGVTASIDGSGSGGQYVPALQIIDQAGHVVLTCVASSTLAQGASADVSWFPGPLVGASAQPSGSTTGNKAFYLNSGATAVNTQLEVDFSGLTSGVQLLDVSDPIAPNVLADGFYVYTLWAECTDGSTAGDTFELGLDMDTAGDNVPLEATFPLFSNESGGIPRGAITLGYFIPAGSGIDGVIRAPAAGVNFTYEMTLMFIAGELN